MHDVSALGYRVSATLESAYNKIKTIEEYLSQEYLKAVGDIGIGSEKIHELFICRWQTHRKHQNPPRESVEQSSVSAQVLLVWLIWSRIIDKLKKIENGRRLGSQGAEVSDYDDSIL